jgi:exodeoxyribonuclease VII small subunit
MTGREPPTRFTGPVDALPDDVAAMTYEQARDELVTVVQRLEAGDQTLEQSLELWERGEALAARCQQWLDGARERLAAARAASAEPQAEDPPDEEQ